MAHAIPLRDLSTEDQRGLIGNVVTVKVYEDAESTEPEAVVNGRLALILTTDELTLLMFEHQIGTPSPLPASNVVTVEWLS